MNDINNMKNKFNDDIIKIFLEANPEEKEEFLKLEKDSTFSNQAIGDYITMFVEEVRATLYIKFNNERKDEFQTECYYNEDGSGKVIYKRDSSSLKPLTKEEEEMVKGVN